MMFNQKRIYKSLSDLDKLFRDGNVYFITLHATNNVAEYTIVVFDDSHRYVCESPNCTSFDFRMLRKIYTNVYYWSEEIDAIWPARS